MANTSKFAHRQPEKRKDVEYGIPEYNPPSNLENQQPPSSGNGIIIVFTSDDFADLFGD